jgi:hypothetical protein
MFNTIKSSRGKKGFSAIASLAIIAVSATALASEPINNTIPKVNNLPNGDMQVLGGFGSNQVNGAITASDTDFIFLGCSSHSVIDSVVLSNLTADLDLYIFDISGPQVASSAAGGSTTEFITGLGNPSGPYTSALIAKVVGFSGATSNYKLTVNCLGI